MTLGPLMIDIAGITLTDADAELLRHPLVGGIILFTRNYESPQQLSDLCASIHALRTPRLLIAVDHEGGRVQRFQKGFTRLPPASAYGQLYNESPERGLELARQGGWLMASELIACGVDISFAPVLDMDYGISIVMAERAFHRQAAATAQLAQAWTRGMRAAGMAATGKHFPGHGGVAADSHTELPVDTRPFEDLQHHDMQPFRHLINNHLPAIMMAHVVYPQYDNLPASFSKAWISTVLRGQLKFNGAIFCDDLSMQGAVQIGDYTVRAQRALAAGCDMLPVCNNRAGALEIIAGLEIEPNPTAHSRLIRLHANTSNSPASNLRDLQGSSSWRSANEAVCAMEPAPELPLDE